MQILMNFVNEADWAQVSYSPNPGTSGQVGSYCAAAPKFNPVFSVSAVVYGYFYNS